jgi:hypothetical protein
MAFRYAVTLARSARSCGFRGAAWALVVNARMATRRKALNMGFGFPAGVLGAI